MKTNSLKSTFCPGLNNSDNKPGFRRSLRPIMFGLTIGLGVGLATKNVGVGIALGVAFATANGVFGRRAD